MDCIEMMTEGAAGSAARLGRTHLAKGVADQWLVTLRTPRLFTVSSTPLLLSQLMLIVSELDALPSGGYPRERGATHGVLLGLLATEFRMGSLEDSVKPRVYPASIGYAEVELLGRPEARMAGRIVASCLASGRVALGTRSTRTAFVAAVHAAAIAADLTTIVSMSA